MVCDINGLELSKGDVVAPVSGDMKGKVCGLKSEDGEGFVCVRAAHRPYSKGVWYASEHVQRLAIGKIRPRKTAENGDANGAAASSNGNGNGKTATNGNGEAPHRNGQAKRVSTKSASKSTAKRSGRRTVTSN
ncbi:MAG: hypothetical protein WD294_16605 [Phycisphaeraceae bacterium]